MDTFTIPLLPPGRNLESPLLLKKTASAHRYLAELKGVSGQIPNQAILINTLALQEAKDSSAIENIITSHDELFKEELHLGYVTSAATKEVRNYSEALRKGFELIRKNNLFTNGHILEIQSILERNDAGFRTLPGTNLKNQQTGEVVYLPPQEPETILKLMDNLERYINDDSISDVDPLIKMAVVHYQFESIHPFYDGNGRAGRIINILYLVLKGLLDIPVLYLSRYIIQNKNDYYRLLQGVRTDEQWEEWVYYMLDGVEKTSIQTIQIIHKIKSAMMDYKHRIRDEYRFYSQDLINNLFRHPYTKIEFLQNDLQVSRLTAVKYLDQLADSGYLKKEKLGRANYYINNALFDLFLNVPDIP